MSVQLIGIKSKPKEYRENVFGEKFQQFGLSGLVVQYKLKQILEYRNIKASSVVKQTKGKFFHVTFFFFLIYACLYFFPLLIETSGEQQSVFSEHIILLALFLYFGHVDGFHFFLSSSFVPSLNLETVQNMDSAMYIFGE